MALIGVDFVEIIEKLDFWRCCATATAVISRFTIFSHFVLSFQVFHLQEQLLFL